MEATRNQLKRLRVDSLYGKKKHFNAADRKDSLSNWLNIPALLVNAILASVLLSNLQKEEPGLFKWVSAILAIIATLLTALAAYWKLAKQVEGHRRVANKFLRVVKGAERLLAFEKDELISGAAFAAEFKELASLADDANSEAEAFTTKDKDFEKARKGLESGEETYLPNELEP